jgi:DNA replication and repair protein RecF
VRVSAVRAAGFRCYDRLSTPLAAGIVGVVGPNGAGKTTLVEAVHFACLGYSPRTSNDAQLVRFGSDFLRAGADAESFGVATTVEVAFQPGEPKRARVGGSPVRSIERLLERFPVLVFTPDRLRLVQGSPALRRSYLDRSVARIWPVLAPAAAEYGRALAQRNHLLRRLRAGAAALDALDAWDQRVAAAGAALGAARYRLLSRLSSPFEERLRELGGSPEPHALRYLPDTEGGEAELIESLSARRSRDIDRAATGAGPHLDDMLITDGGRDLRRYGSQGEQRRALLALILAEADLLADERGEQPLLLLDDVTGEFDRDRRRLLLEAVGRFDQAILTTTDRADLRGSESLLLEVDAGTVRAA